MTDTPPRAGIKTAKTNQDLVHVRRRSGHRGAYQDLFRKCLELSPTQGSVRRHFKAFLAAPRLLFATLDGQEFGFLTIGLLRALIGRPTVGLFLRPQSCFDLGLKAKAKYALFAAMRRVPGVRVLTIVPFSVEPQYARIATDWIHDPQLWDLMVQGRLSSVRMSGLSCRVENVAAGRPVLAFLGTVRRSKGSSMLINALQATPGWNQRFLVVVAGKVADDAQEDARFVEANGGMVIDRSITDEELESLYQVSQFIWCCYDPIYDQASGIFGRAVQFGRKAIIREGSLLHRMTKADPALGEAIVHTPGHPLSLSARNAALSSVSVDSQIGDLALQTIRNALVAA